MSNFPHKIQPEAEPESIQSKLQRFDEESKRPKKKQKLAHNQQQPRGGQQPPNPEEEENSEVPKLLPSHALLFTG